MVIGRITQQECNSFANVETPQRCHLSHGNGRIYRAAHQILLIVVGRLRNASRNGATPTVAFEFTVSEYAQMYDLPSAEASKDIRKDVNGFASREVVLYMTEEDSGDEKGSVAYPWMIQRSYNR